VSSVKKSALLSELQSSPRPTGGGSETPTQLLQEVAHDGSLGTMAPLDLDKYAEIAKQCKYLPENDLKVSVTS